MSRGEVPPDPIAGLCDRCRHRRLVRSRHSSFVRCGLADSDPWFERYPRLPVIACKGFQELEPAASEVEAQR